MLGLSLRTRAAIRSGAAFLWPSRSLLTGEIHGGDGPLSAEDFAQLHFLSGGCARCAMPLEDTFDKEEVCAACLARPPRWDEARAALAYDDASRQPVLGLKRAGRRDGLAAMGGWMAAAGRDCLDTADLLVPVPLHYRRLAARGFNQAGWLAQAVSKQSGVPCGLSALKRVRVTQSQGGLSARARRRNVAGAFAVRTSAEARIGGRHVVLVDDVLTTGATLSGCARALKRAGAARVDVLVLARVVRPTDVTI